MDSWLHRPHPCFVRNKLLIEKQLIIYLSSQLTLLLLALSSAALDGHQSLADGALPGRPVLSGHHAVHQRGRHHLEGVAAVARRQGHGELGGASDLQHLGQSDLLRGRGGDTESFITFIESHRKVDTSVLAGEELYPVVLGAALVLVQSDALPVQDPVVTLPLRTHTSVTIRCLKVQYVRLSVETSDFVS